jgi:hypothetical protein
MKQIASTPFQQWTEQAREGTGESCLPGLGLAVAAEGGSSRHMLLRAKPDDRLAEGGWDGREQAERHQREILSLAGCVGDGDSTR